MEIFEDSHGQLSFVHPDYRLSRNYLKCQDLKEKCTEDMEAALKQYGYRMKFPAKSGDLSRRWCSAYTDCRCL